MTILPQDIWAGLTLIVILLSIAGIMVGAAFLGELNKLESFANNKYLILLGTIKAWCWVTLAIVSISICVTQTIHLSQ